MGRKALANILEVRPPTVYGWKSGTRPIPVRFCARIEAATEGRVTRKDLRPDDWQAIWPELEQAQST